MIRGKFRGRPATERLKAAERRASNPHDFYPTPAYVTEGLLEREQFTGKILEPACGQGHMASVLRAHGYEVEAKDIQGGHNFLRRSGPVPNVVTNPPYSHPLLEEFVRHALQIAARKAAFLVPYWFLEAHCRRDLLERRDFPLAAIYQFIDRPEFIEGKKCPYPVLWLVWERGHLGPARGGVIARTADDPPAAARHPQILSLHDIASPHREEQTMSNERHGKKSMSDNSQGDASRRGPTPGGDRAGGNGTHAGSDRSANPDQFTGGELIRLAEFASEFGGRRRLSRGLDVVEEICGLAGGETQCA